MTFFASSMLGILDLSLVVVSVVSVVSVMSVWFDR